MARYARDRYAPRRASPRVRRAGLRWRRVRSLRAAVAAEHALRDRRDVHLVGSVVDASAALVRPPERERRFVRETERSQRLDRAVEHPLQRARDGELDDRDVVTGLGGAFLLDRPSRAQHHQARAVDLRAAFGDPLLHELARTEQVSWRELARRGALAKNFESALADADPAHAMVDAPRAEPCLRQLEPRSFLAEQVRKRHARAVVPDFAVALVIGATMAHHRDVADQLESW